MKAILITNIWIGIVACVFVFLQHPIVKMTTSYAMNAIETNFIRDDLSSDEKDHFTSLRNRVEWNQMAAMDSLRYTQFGTGLIGILLIAQNLVVLSILRRQHRAEQAEDTKPDNVPS